MSTPGGLGAIRAPDLGTSYGGSTLYLASAVRDNFRAAGSNGVVIGAEYEPEKARHVCEHFYRRRVEQLLL